jgi:hypothetical protein
MIVAKMSDGRIVEIVRVSEKVGFSDCTGWICVAFEIGKMTSSMAWFPISTKFDWGRKFSF